MDSFYHNLYIFTISLTHQPFYFIPLVINSYIYLVIWRFCFSIETTHTKNYSYICLGGSTQPGYTYSLKFSHIFKDLKLKPGNGRKSKSTMIFWIQKVFEVKKICSRPSQIVFVALLWWIILIRTGLEMQMNTSTYKSQNEVF